MQSVLSVHKVWWCIIKWFVVAFDQINIFVVVVVNYSCWHVLKFAWRGYRSDSSLQIVGVCPCLSLTPVLYLAVGFSSVTDCLVAVSASYKHLAKTLKLTGLDLWPLKGQVHILQAVAILWGYFVLKGKKRFLIFATAEWGSTFMYTVCSWDNVVNALEYYMKIDFNRIQEK